MSHPVNPYVPGGSVGDSSAFVGREEILAEVEQGLQRSGRYVMVLEGPRGSGKTSLLDELVRRLNDKDRFPAVRFDVEPRASHTLSSVVVDLAESIAAVRKLARPDLGQWPEGRFTDEWLRTVLDTLDANERLVLVFDEFEVAHHARSSEARSAFLPFLAGLVEDFGDRLGVILCRGRNPGDRRSDVLRHFGSAQRRRLSPLTVRDSRALIRLTELDRSLLWSSDAVEAVIRFTGGHPYQVQLLCHRIWDEAHREVHEGVVQVTALEVDAAVNETLIDAGDAFEWMWEGLEPASRVVAAALARHGEPIEPGDLPRVLHRIGVNFSTRTMEEAPHALRKVGLLEPDGDDLVFRGELLARWLREHKPLTSVQADLDHVDPVADHNYRQALFAWREHPADRRVEDTARLLEMALAHNPNHGGATELMAEVMLARGEENKAILLLERLATWQPAVARPRIVPLLMHRLESAESDEERMLLLDRILQVAPGHREAERALLDIRIKEARSLEAAGDLDGARRAFERLGADDEVERLDTMVDQQRIQEAEARIARLERDERFLQALDEATRAQKRFPGGPFADTIRRLDRATRMAQLYQQGLGALQQGDRRAAAERLAEVISIKHDYEQAPRYLYEAVYGVDPTAVAAPPRANGVPVWAFAAACIVAVGFGVVVALDSGESAVGPTVSVEALTAAPSAGAPVGASVAAAPPAGATPAPAASPAVETAAAPTEAPPQEAAAAPEPTGTDVEPETEPAAAAPASAPAPAPKKTKSKPRHRARNPTALMAQGWRQIDESDLSGAFSTFEHATRTAPFDGSAWYGFGYVEEQRGRLDKAAEHYCKALDRAGGEVDLIREVQGRLRSISRNCR